MGRVREPRWNNSGRCSGSMTICRHTDLASSQDVGTGLEWLKKIQLLLLSSSSVTAQGSGSDKQVGCASGHLPQCGLDIVQRSNVIEAGADLARRNDLQHGQAELGVQSLNGRAYYTTHRLCSHTPVVNDHTSSRSFFSKSFRSPISLKRWAAGAASACGTSIAPSRTDVGA